MKLPISLLAITVLLPIFLTGQSDVPGSSDHPLLSRFPDANIAWYQTEKYREYKLATGPITSYRHIEEVQEISGSITRIFYELPKAPAEVTVGEVYLNYLSAGQEAGMTILAKGLYAESNVKKGVGGNSWIGVALKDQAFPGNTPAGRLFAGSSTSGGSFAIVMHHKKPGNEVYVAIYGRRYSSKLIQIHVDILQPDQAELGRVAITPDYLAAQLKAYGTVRIYGLNFAFDSAELEQGHQAVLDQIAAFLRENPTTKLFVVGHTDMQGSLTYNLDLSKRRATTVVNALVNAHGIAADRLQPEGLGFLAPVASNEEELGRKQNRRVELVLRRSQE